MHDAMRLGGASRAHRARCSRCVPMGVSRPRWTRLAPLSFPLITNSKFDSIPSANTNNFQAVVINGDGTLLQAPGSGFFVKPVRSLGASAANMRYNPVSGEITYNPGLRRRLLTPSEEADVQDMEAAEAALVWDLRLVSYRHTLEAEVEHDRAYGFVAQEVAAIDPRLALWDEDGEVEGVDYEQLVPLLLHQIKALKDSHEAKIAAIEDKLGALLR